MKALCINNRTKMLTFLDEFKCSLPEVETIDGNLDISRFRSDFSKISEVRYMSNRNYDLHFILSILLS